MDNNINDFLLYLGVNPKNADLSSLNNFLESVHAKGTILKYVDVCKKNYNKYIKGDHVLYANIYRRARNVFIGNIRTPASHWDEAEKLLRTLILDYYFDSYIEDALIPHIDKNRDGDRNRARISFEKAKSIYTTTKSDADKNYLDIKEKEYKKVCSFYDNDWNNRFRTIKQINKIIHQNEVSRECVARGVSVCK